MAFRKIQKPARRTVTSAPSITLSTSSRASGAYMAFNSGSMKLLGEPAAVHFEWDDETCMLRIHVSSPDAPEAFVIGKHARASVTGLISEIGVAIPETTRIPVRPETRLPVLADLSALPAARALRRVA